MRSHLLAAVFVAVTLAWSSAAHAQYAGDKDPSRLVLSTTICHDYDDTLSIARCLDDQNKKADRWLTAIVASVARQASEAMTDLAHGGEPFDQVAQLHKSEAVFRQYRDETAELVHRYGLVGSLNGLLAAESRFQLTVDRAHFLLALCNSRRRIEASEAVDLTRVDWCPPAL